MNRGTWLAIGSAIVLLVSTIATNMWFEYSDKAESIYNNYVGPVLDETELPLFVTVLIVVTVILIAAAIYKHRTNQLIERNQELEEQSNSEMQTLISANKQLSDYRFQENLETIFRKFVSRNKYVQAVQSYLFEEKNRGKKTIFTLKYLAGAVCEGVNINAIHQMVFPVNRNDLKEFRSALKSFEEESYTELVPFIIRSNDRLQAQDTLTDEETGLYMLMDLALEAFEGKTEMDLTAPFNQEQKSRLEELRNSRRTGLVRAGILRNGFYSFTHEGSNEKANRQYLAVLAILGKEFHLFSIAMDSSILDEGYEQALNEVKTEFTLLLTELENGYNT